MNNHEGATVEFAGAHTRGSSVSLLTEATSNLNTIDDDITKVHIYNDLSEFEEILGRLVESVDKYKPDLNIAKELIKADTKLFKSLDSFSKYDEIDSKMKQLDEESGRLDVKTKEVLEILNECHDDLNALPMLEQVEFEMDTILKQREKINSSVLLDYATKLSKFTKIPPTFDRGSIGPNNFIWPAEDALRRGMLAIASLHSKEMTTIPGKENEEEEKLQTTTIENTTINKPDFPQNERKNSFVFGGDNTETSIGKEKDNEDEDAMDLDLDLFNPDDF